MKQIYNVLIIGAGKIGAFFDSPESDNVLTHAHAFTDLTKFKLVGFVDSDLNKAQKAAKLWHTNFFKSIADAFDFYAIDIVCVAASTDFHYQILKELSLFDFRLAFVEKPFVRFLDQANEIREIYKEKYIPVLVNYSRRFIPEFDAIREKIRNNFYGKYLCGTGYYGKGILNNGSHLIDLSRYFLGDIYQEDFISCGFDFSKDDPSVSAILTLKDNKKFFLQNIDCNCYTHFEMDLFFEQGRIRIVDSGFKIEEYSIKKSEVFAGYKNLVKKSETGTGLSKALYYSANNIFNYLSYNEELKCSVDDAIKVLDLCLSMKKRVLNYASKKDIAFL